MPHDVDGKPLKAGDKVTIEFDVRQVYESEKCNVQLAVADREFTCDANICKKVE